MTGSSVAFAGGNGDSVDMVHLADRSIETLTAARPDRGAKPMPLVVAIGPPMSAPKPAPIRAILGIAEGAGCREALSPTRTRQIMHTQRPREVHVFHAPMAL